LILFDSLVKTPGVDEDICVTFIDNGRERIKLNGTSNFGDGFVKPS
jgi:hypothetical protein